MTPDNEDGATGDYDLYHEGGGNQYDSVQAVNAPNVYYFPAVTAPAKLYFSCQEAFAWPPFPPLGVGGSFCFRSSKMHTGYVSILRRNADNAVVLHVTIWEDR
ncbi:hypothetical protein ABZ342_42400 [Amycolatopsis sp. NPDC005961]|uniref:hypothetical protein n=1 Tax=Amycolatopsis sp. NPDC005961 TaxID=3156720 RepID=UPI0033E7D4F9